MIQKAQLDKLQKEGRAAYERGDFQAAAEAFGAVSEALATQGDLLASAEMRNNRSVALLQARDAQGALECVDGTETIFAGAGDIRRQALALGNRAAALEALGRFEESVTDYETCAGLLEQIGEDQLRATAMQSLSALQLRMGRQLEALASMSAGLKGLKRPSPKQRIVRKLLQAPFKLK